MPFKFIYQSAQGSGTLAEANYPDTSSVGTWSSFEEEGPKEHVSDIGKAFTFQSQFEGTMALEGDRATVMDYLDAHQGWFCRCAEPMKVTPLDNNGYSITVGHYGAHGFEVEPKIALHLLPHEAGIYRIETLTLPEQQHQCYEVGFDAQLSLVESDGGATPTTQVQWTLDLQVDIHFPKFIYRLPQKIIQYTGDALLSKIVKQVSKRLTAKVQADFHQNHPA